MRVYIKEHCFKFAFSFQYSFEVFYNMLWLKSNDKNVIYPNFVFRTVSTASRPNSPPSRRCPQSSACQEGCRRLAASKWNLGQDQTLLWFDKTWKTSCDFSQKSELHALYLCGLLQNPQLEIQQEPAHVWTHKATNTPAAPMRTSPADRAGTCLSPREAVSKSCFLFLGVWWKYKQRTTGTSRSWWWPARS